MIYNVDKCDSLSRFVHAIYGKKHYFISFILFASLCLVSQHSLAIYCLFCVLVMNEENLIWHVNYFVL